MPSTGFKPVTPAISRLQTYTSDGTDAGIDHLSAPPHGPAQYFVVFVVNSLEFFRLTIKQ